MMKPGECYLSQENGHPSFHSMLFAFIDFGPRANYFLANCGVKNVPNIDDIARMLVKKPQEFLESCGGPTELVSVIITIYNSSNLRVSFKQELKKIAFHYQEISPETRRLMAISPILISEKRGPETSNMTYSILRASHVSR
jgi:hypothetical protein